MPLLHRHPPPLQDLPQPQPFPAMHWHAEPDMRKVMHAAGGPNYETVLLETGPDSKNIPSEQCGGEAMRVDLKRMARNIMIARSVAETFAVL